jgi:hypothetical protein
MLKSFELAPGGIIGVEFSPDGKWLLTGGSNHRLWRVGNWVPGPVFGDAGGGAFSPDSSYVALDTTHGAIRLVDVNSGVEFARLEDPRQRRAYWITFSPDGTKLLTISGEYNALQVWDLRAIREELTKFGLDWKRPAFPPADDTDAKAALRLSVDLGNLAP